MSESSPVKVVVIGGGAAGLVAAIAARYKGADVTILEKNQRVGKKILATGNGRCNLTNVNLDISCYHGKNPDFARAALSRFDFKKTIDFFEDLGIAHKVEEAGKVFPVSNQASSVLDVLRYELEKTGVNVFCEATVKDIQRSRRGFDILLADGRKFKAGRVILAAGGKAAPNLGSNGSGYALAQNLGHSIVEPFPALVQLKLAAKFLKQVQGVKFEGEAAIIFDNKTVQKAAGEILFTEYGASGPPILCLSRKAGEYLQRGEGVWLKLTLVTEMEAADLEKFLNERFRRGPQKELDFSFVGFINKKLIPVVLKEAGVADLKKPAGQVSAGERASIARILRDWRFAVKGTTSWPAAQVTAGGVDVKDIYGQTMESRIVPGLYFAGEIVDIDGDCGGYNLQWAWSSGYVAGSSAAANSPE
ncbi:NAD(P)/FAD-dependent oxidoreductase [Pelotomaculum propionicicum]|uniref:Ferredoxin--NADP reductase n=1 Tax=Pelotomaculum propionicicum TaxID=258475 RepID=A0A4Y7RUD2_9FIRM|nr:NAD(P)/FAD-dependent oxidoreductase [Pelotomaculum propionicicum]NLI11846.1 NAD(P)/FAD-dependent oxidoreductase [Peptococcaceae bacterium]TEB12380.1 Ferredoxin--NADP reductase [Pelotomaculum propionicicum]